MWYLPKDFENSGNADLVPPSLRHVRRHSDKLGILEINWARLMVATKYGDEVGLSTDKLGLSTNRLG